MMYQKAIDLLHQVSTNNGFLASAENTTNYQRVWARDGVICGLAALASGDEQLILTFRKTLETLAKHQHSNGTIPSNVLINDGKKEVSYGGLAGRVDAVTWFIIGVCQYGFYTKDENFVQQMQPNIEKCLSLLEAWNSTTNICYTFRFQAIGRMNILLMVMFCTINYCGFGL